ncbi:MAG: phenylalanine--tRNA ligase subunit alpha [Rickettsiales bacterium]|jgi:phenylalanyl-tRNA synthetase alpha chain|nr:phenylalanine--tRNA ligase subunit alpha [Rickettsiales bacterium]
MKKIREIREKFLVRLGGLKAIENIREIKSDFLGKNSEISEMFREMLSLPEGEKKALGVEINELRAFIEKKIREAEEGFLREKIKAELEGESLDITLPAREEKVGRIHPLSYVMRELENVALSMGFSITSDSEIANDWYCFESLNIPKHHPARQMQDTFFLPRGDDGDVIILRSQTTSADVWEMENKKPPFKFINYGKTFRSEMDATHAPMFHQMDFVCVDKEITAQDLKNCLMTLMKKFFNLNEVPLRFRPSYFPFTSPSIEVDIKYKRENDRLILGEGEKWLEILGSGMLHPNVLRNANINPDEYQGFAFALGVERMGMLKYGIKDIRNLYDGDMRFLNAYGFKLWD